MTEKMKELEEDIGELKKLLLDAERPNVQNYLAQQISKLKTELDTLSAIKAPEIPKPQVVQKVSNESKEIDKSSFLPMNKYAWDQEGSKVKIIFSLQGIGSQITKEQVEVFFDTWSIQMRLKGYKGHNHLFGIKKLFAEINPAQCKFLLKKNGITIIMIKKENKSWDQVSYKEKKLSSDKEEKEDMKDPSAGMMNMMKKMYEEGDDNMKKTIAEAWTKANDKKAEGKGHDFSDRFDPLNK